MELRSERPPEALLDNIITTVRDRFLGFEALALASIAERRDHTGELELLPAIPGMIDSTEAKIGLARAWLRCWQGRGFWLNAMPPVWWKRPRSQGISIGGQKGKFAAMATVLGDKDAQKVFWDQWSPKLLKLFTEDTEGGVKRLRGSQLTLKFEGTWVHCLNCKSVAPADTRIVALLGLWRGRNSGSGSGFGFDFSRSKRILPKDCHGSA